MEKVAETKICKHCGTSFDITDKDLEFYEKVSPVFSSQEFCHSELDSESLEKKNLNSKKDPDPDLGTGGQKNLIKNLGNGKVKSLIPSPTLCPDCRNQRRLAFINVSHLYKSGNIVSPYSPDKGFNIIPQKDWFSLKIDGKDFGRDFDFHKSFFEQFTELQKVAPRWDRISENSENCERSLNIANSQNCYFVKSSIGCKNCYYSSELRGENYNLVDCYKINNGNFGYQVISSNNFSNIFWSEKIENCNYGMFLYECENCDYCIGCVGLKNKKYFILNKEVSQEEYKKLYGNIVSNQELKNNFLKDFQKLKHDYPRLSLKIINSQDCNGDEIYNSKNIFSSFFVSHSSESKYLDACTECHFCYDCSQPDFAEKCYELSSVYKFYNSNFCFNTLDATSCYYCETCGYIENCFGCVGLNTAKYCILNKQYTKEEYEKLVPKIIEYMEKTGEWGEFFPASISPFGYNETVASEYYPLTREEVKVPVPFDGTGTKKGKIFNWSDYEAPFPKVEKIIPAIKLPDDISKIPDDILNWAIECETTKKPFRIIKKELDFYRKHNLPIPRRHPDQRHSDRMKLRNPRKLFERICDCPTCEENHKDMGKFKEEDFALNKKTGKKGLKIQTTYAPERPEIVYCQTCYDKEIY